MIDRRQFLLSDFPIVPRVWTSMFLFEARKFFYLMIYFFEPLKLKLVGKNCPGSGSRGWTFPSHDCEDTSGRVCSAHASPLLLTPAFQPHWLNRNGGLSITCPLLRRPRKIFGKILDEIWSMYQCQGFSNRMILLMMTAYPGWDVAAPTQPR